MSTSSILDVKDVTVQEDGGEYTCVTSNTFTNKSTTFIVDVHCKKNNDVYTPIRGFDFLLKVDVL